MTEDLKQELEQLSGWIIPEHDVLEWLLGKLKPKIVVKKKIYGLVLTSSTSDGSWIGDYLSWTWQEPLPERSKDYWLHSGNRAQLTEANTPRDAVGKLLIQLFKQGVLVREPIRNVAGNSEMLGEV